MHCIFKTSREKKDSQRRRTRVIIQRSSDSIAIPPDSSRYDPSNNHPQSAKNVKSSLTHCIWKLQSAKQNRSLESGNINVTHTHTHTHTHAGKTRRNEIPATKGKLEHKAAELHGKTNRRGG